MRRPRSETLVDTLERAIAALGRCRDAVPWMLAHVRDFERGFPSVGGGDSGGDDTSSTERIALASLGEEGRPAPDPARLIDEWLAEVAEAASQAIVVGGHTADLLPIMARVVEDPGCVSCARFGVFTMPDRGSRKRCGACQKYFQRHGEDPPEAVVRERDQRRRRVS